MIAPGPGEAAAIADPAAFEADLLAGDEDMLDLDTGSLSAATQQFSSGLTALKSSMANAATVWNGQASELLSLPLSATIVEALTVDQIEGWGAKGNVRMLLGVLNTMMPETAPSEASARLNGHREAALRVILGRGAKSLDALVVSLGLSRSERILREVDAVVQQAGDAMARGGALAAMQMLADAGGPFGRNAASLITDKRLAPIPKLSDVRIAARERGAAAAVIRVDAIRATHEKERADLQANCQRLRDLAETVVHGPDGPAVRIRHAATVTSGFEDLLATFARQFAAVGDGTNLSGDRQTVRRLSALFESPELAPSVELLEELWLTVLQDWCAFAGALAAFAVDLADRANFKGLPTHVAATERLALLAQAGAELTGTTEALQREIGEIDRAMIGLPEDTPLFHRQQQNRVAILACRGDLQAAADAVMQAIAGFEGAVRTDEAMFRKRVVEIETLSQDVQRSVHVLQGLLGSPDWHDPVDGPVAQAQASACQADLVTAIRAFAVIGGGFSRLGGMRMLAVALEGIAAVVERLTGDQPAQATEARSAVAAALTRAQQSGMVRQPEIEAVGQLLGVVDGLFWARRPAG